MTLVLDTGPSVEPITLAETREHLNLTAAGSPATHADDDLLNNLIAAARELVDGRDGFLGRALISQTWDLKLDRLREPITVPLPPLQSISSITYTDTDGNAQTLASTEYQVTGVGGFGKGKVVEAYGKSWPSTRNIPEAVTVTFVAGYGAAAANVPEPIRTALKILVATWYENREALVTGTIATQLPLSVQMLLAPYRVYGF